MNKEIKKEEALKILEENVHIVRYNKNWKTLKQFINQQPNKDQLRDEIIELCYNSKIDDLQVVNVEFYKDGDNEFIICTNSYGDENEIARYDSELGLQLEWYLPLSLASKIIKYFELESDDNDQRI